MIVVLLFALAGEDAEIKDGKVFVSKTHNLTFSIPSATWGKLRVGKELEWKWVGALCEGMDAGENVGLALTAEAARRETNDYIGFFEKSMAKDVDTKRFAPVGGKAIEGRTGDWIRRDYEWDFRDTTFLLIAAFTRREEYNYKLCVWVEKRLWDKRQLDVNGILESFNLLEPR